MILYLSNFLSAHGITPQPCEFLVTQLQNQYHIKWKSSKKNNFARAYDQIFALVKYRKKIKLVIIDLYAYNSFYLSCLCGFMCRVLKLPYVSVLHSNELVSKFSRKSRLLFSFLKGAKVNISPSGFFAELLTKNNFPSKVISNPIELNLYKSVDVTLDYPRMLWVRTIHTKYNPLLALKVLKRIIPAFKESKLTMVGPFTEPAYSDCVRFVKENSLEKSVTFSGLLHKKDWIAMAGKYNLFINTTNLDNAPVSMMEAAALNLPMVSTNVGGIPYLFENNKEAVLVDPDNEIAFSEAVVTLFRNDTTCKLMTENARKKVEGMGWGNVVKDWQILFTEMGISSR